MLGPRHKDAPACRRRLPLLALLAASLLACGGRDEPPTDEELLEQFVQDVTGVVDSPMIVRGLSYVALQEVPLDVRVPHYSGVYQAERSEALTKRYHADMQRFFGGSEIKVRGKKITIEGTEAHVQMRLTTVRGPVVADVDLRKLSDGWKVSRLRAQPGL